MNEDTVKVPTYFGEETRFEVRPVAAVPLRELQESRFERLKSQLLRDQLDELWEPEFSAWLRRAANEAAAVAWLTPYPLLVFPALFEEKAVAAVRRAANQASVYERSHNLTQGAVTA